LKMRLLHSSWYDEELELELPDAPKVVHAPPADAPAIGDEEIRAAFMNPIGTRRISELAGGRKTVTVVVDDLTRPTPAWRIAPFLLEELRAGGIGAA